VYATRAKLYVMQTDGGWRERGVGTVKLNLRRSDGRGARLGKFGISAFRAVDTDSKQ
jgi:hypothetical protein